MPNDENLDALRTWPSLIALGGEQWIGRPVEGLPMIEDLPADHQLRVQWQRAADG
jgi:hypothetical protein